MGIGNCPGICCIIGTPTYTTFVFRRRFLRRLRRLRFRRRLGFFPSSAFAAASPSVEATVAAVPAAEVVPSKGEGTGNGICGQKGLNNKHVGSMLNISVFG